MKKIGTEIAVTLRGDRVLVEPFHPPRTSPGGIVIPDVVTKVSTRGKVLAVGPGRANDDGVVFPIIGVSVGDVVLFSSYSGFDVEVNGKSYKIVSEAEILGTVDA